MRVMFVAEMFVCTSAIFHVLPMSGMSGRKLLPAGCNYERLLDIENGIPTQPIACHRRQLEGMSTYRAYCGLRARLGELYFLW